LTSSGGAAGISTFSLAVAGVARLSGGSGAASDVGVNGPGAAEVGALTTGAGAMAAGAVIGMTEAVGFAVATSPVQGVYEP